VERVEKNSSRPGRGEGGIRARVRFDERNSSDPPGRRQSNASESTGSTTPKAASLHPWLQPFARFGAMMALRERPLKRSDDSAKRAKPESIPENSLLFRICPNGSMTSSPGLSRRAGATLGR